MSAAMIARYSGRCYVCQGSIHKGEPIVHEGRKRSSHERCAGSKSVAVMFSSGARVWRNRAGRCEDAPCCGCCD
jgi:hypothetical protein